RLRHPRRHPCGDDPGHGRGGDERGRGAHRPRRTRRRRQRRGGHPRRGRDARRAAPGVRPAVTGGRARRAAVREYVLTALVVAAADDKWGLDALTKLAGQILAAGIMVLQGVQFLYLPIPRYGALSLGSDLGVPLTVLFVVVTINAVNFIDGLDGLAAGVVGIA